MSGLKKQSFVNHRKKRSIRQPENIKEAKANFNMTSMSSLPFHLGQRVSYMQGIYVKIVKNYVMFITVMEKKSNF